MNNIQAKKPKKFQVKNGDLFSLGNHLLFCGSSLIHENVSELLNGRKIRAIISDPPYGVNFVASKKGFSQLKVQKDILNDDIISEEKYRSFSVNWLKPALPYMEDKNGIYIFNSEVMLFALRDALKDCGIRFSQLLIWIKNHPVIGRKDYLPMHEFIIFGWYGRHKFRGAKDRSVLFFPKPSRNPHHPTQKPIGLLRKLILNSTDIGDWIYDPFVGGGSTILAAEQTRRKCLAMEIDLDYCKTIINRFERLTGIKAKKLN